MRPLFAKALFRSEVVAALRANPSLSEPVREEAVALAKRFVELPLASTGPAEPSPVGPARNARRTTWQFSGRDSLAVSCRSWVPTRRPSGYDNAAWGNIRRLSGHADEHRTNSTRRLKGGHCAGGPGLSGDVPGTRWGEGPGRRRGPGNQLRETMQKPYSSPDEEAESLQKEAETLVAGSGLHPEKRQRPNYD